MAGPNVRYGKSLDRHGGVWLLPLAIAVVAFAAVGSTTTWVTLTVAGLAMGMMIFLMASGLSLIFGLMDVLNFGHAAFVSFGAFIATSVLAALSHWVQTGSVILNLAAILAALTAASLFGAVVGWAYERIIVKPVYGDHLRQILITVGALIVSEELIWAIWGSAPIHVARPAFLDGSIIVGNVAIETYRVFVFLVGLAVFFALHLVLNRTRIGLLVRAGVENREMVESLGFRIDRLFVAVFVAGSALAALGGGMWAGFQSLINARVGSQILVLVFIVVIIGGLGSVEGSLLGALMVGLTANYVAFLFPKLSLASNMLLMMAILLWKPYGLKPAVKSWRRLPLPRATSLPHRRARHRSGRFVVYALVGLTGLALLFAPFLFPDVRAQQVAARICVFVVLVASYDLLIGYTGIVSFAHTMFFGLGAYGTAITLKTMGAGWPAVIVGGAAGLAAALVLALLIGLLSLRVKAIFFAMVTLAVASVMMVFASQLSGFTGGEDGIIYQAPHVFSSAFRLLTDADGHTLKLLGVRMTGKVAAYYFVLAASLVLFLVMLRIVASPLGTVLQAIRENEMRAEAIGYRVVAYRTAIFCISAAIAALAGVIWAVWLKYTGPDVVLSFSIMIDILLMVVIGGMGTMLGSVIGVVVMSLAQSYLKNVLAVAASAVGGVPLLPQLLDPDRWLLWLGIFFILLVYFFPAGIAGTLMRRKGL